MARVLLLTPPWQPFHTLQVLFPNVPPLGLQVLAGALKDRGHHATVGDVQHLPPLHDDFWRLLDSARPDVVGISNNEVANLPIVLAVARALRARYPRLRLLAGGQVPTLRPELFVSNGAPFDAVALYEAELTIAPIVEALASGTSLAEVAGVAFAGGGGRLVRTTPERNPCDLDTAPMPHWEDSLKPAAFTSGLAASVETSRGCPHDCSFCSIPDYYGRRSRYKSVDRILDELRRLHALGVRELYFVDDSFGTRPDIALALFQAILRERLGIRFGVQIRADVVVRNPDLITLGARAGMFMAVVGFEGYSRAVRVEGGKEDLERVNLEAARILKREGIVVYGTHVFASPGTGIRDNLRTWFKGRRTADIFRMTIFTPLPGSSCHEELLRLGEIRTIDFGDYYYGVDVFRTPARAAVVQLAYFGLLAAHYASPKTLFKLLAHRDRIIRVFHRRAYRGAVGFVSDRLLGGPWRRDVI